eukprot:8938655-Lingulodinium_polyedra.AAC.1
MVSTTSKATYRARHGCPRRVFIVLRAVGVTQEQQNQLFAPLFGQPPAIGAHFQQVRIYTRR